MPNMFDGYAYPGREGREEQCLKTIHTGPFPNNFTNPFWENKHAAVSSLVPNMRKIVTLPESSLPTF